MQELSIAAVAWEIPFFLALSEWIGDLCGGAMLQPHVNHAPEKEGVQLANVK
jgi:hypothetical protein